MARYYIKPGIPAGDMYETINELTGIIGEDEFGNPIYGPTGWGQENNIYLSKSGDLHIHSSSGNPVDIEAKNGWIVKKCSYKNGIFTIEGGPLGDGHIFFIAPADFTTGDRFVIGTTEAKAIEFMSGDVPTTGDFKAGAPVYGYYAGRKFYLNGGGGGSSKFVLKDGTLANNKVTGKIGIGTNVAYYIDGATQTVSTKNLNSQTSNIGNATVTNLKVGTTTIIDRAGKVYNAVYNDYAEFFPRGEETEPGDIIMLDLSGEDERYVKSTGRGPTMGIHSGEFGFILGGEPGVSIEDNMKNFIPIALSGRVPVKVRGAIRKGQYVEPSEEPGVGVATYSKNFAVGVALESNNCDDVKLVKVKVI